MNVQQRARERCQWLPDLEQASGPRYKALVELMAADIALGVLEPGARLPPQRLLADALGVTVGTITRAYREAERRGLVEARVGSGTRVRSQTDNRPHFHHLTRAGDDSIDLSLSIPIPTFRREQQLALSLQQIATQPQAINTALSYQPEQGCLDQRQQLCRWLETQGLALSPEELILTEGGQHADFLALQALIKPGEAVASAALTYPGMIAAARQLGLKHLGVGTDAEGIRPDLLERLCQQQRIRLLYLMPEYNNPTGHSMSEARRQAIVEVARRHDMLLLEDGVQFVPPQARGTPMHELAPERAMYIFSVSKLLAGGLRFGALRAPANLLPQLRAALRAQCWSSPALMGAVTCQWLTSGEADELLAWQWDEIRHRQALVRELLAPYEVSAHACGFHAWLRLPEGRRAAEFVQLADTQGVTLIAAEPFCVGSQPAPQAVRLCVTPPPTREALAEGLKRVRRLLDDEPPVPAPLL
ncbi:aminotransferase-like domain-containing protein [Marinobacterium weihaiense]|uniref:PLP-dependent aminotransferase family protein n=1 Tax=Marinobacterium weihaiense TaxID=2851016 RepID=A0ABS6M6T4_9GAMM|nr:PLP-dependent aminotransferase family protein [Marinobacterium weihaiense]MBV0931890.1 PLP-dependent aminotransferase family protein [Marinobacterium weihaiense]